jgi:hypothetical protein
MNVFRVSRKYIEQVQWLKYILQKEPDDDQFGRNM